MKSVLEQIVDNINILDLPDSWTCFDFDRFSENKTLYKYQSDALKNAVKALYNFYKPWNESKEIEIDTLKSIMANSYKAYGANISKYDIEDLVKNEHIYDLLKEYFEENCEGAKNKIPFLNFINRMSFWMATGSGKTLLIVKMFVILKRLMKNFNIPEGDIMFLAPRDDLIEQLKNEVDEFNQTPGNPWIELINLKDYNDVKWENKLKFEDEVTVFYYRSDNISEETKELLLSYKDIENGGNWYILLDEAHKGSKNDSVRQAYYTILSRNRFLFNFSATFTEDQDKDTTVANFNLKEFITAGYGKNIYVSKSEFDSFKDKEQKLDDFTLAEKQKIVLKSLITLTYVKKCAEEIKKIDSKMYHEPLLLTLVNSVNVKDADLKMFFKQLVNFANNKTPYDVFIEAKEELEQELFNNEKYAIGNEKLKVHADILRDINQRDVLIYTYNSKGYGSIEVMESGNGKELAFRMKSSDKTSSPFALIKIGDTTAWKRELRKAGYEFIESFEDKNYFDNLDKSPDINILMGSRAFYEGWDSTRPNVINYINIGGEEAQKFVLQSIGRGIRIEPLKDQRKRLDKIAPSPFSYEKKEKLLKYANSLETLFIFATNKSAIQRVLDTTDDPSVVGHDEDVKVLKLDRNDRGYDLLVPCYKEKRYTLEELPEFNISKDTFKRLRFYFKNTPDNVILLNYPMLTLDDLKALKKIILSENPEQSFKFKDSYNLKYRYKDLDVLIFRLKHHIKLKTKVFDSFKQITDEIIHFKKITVSKEKYDEIKEKIDGVISTAKKAPYLKSKKNAAFDKLTNHLQKHKISPQEFQTKFAEINKVYKIKDLKIKYDLLTIEYIPEHYYIPVLYSEKEKIEYINHIITVPSEVRFLKDLEKYISENRQEINTKYDWWMFSKIDETSDKINIPYMNNNKLNYFFPDFIFWLNKDNNYTIIFVDPKSPAYTDAEAKIDYYEKIFKNKIFHEKGYNIKVKLLLITDDESKVKGKKYEHYWTDNISDIFS